MRAYQFVAVVLVYRNLQDLQECIASIQSRVPDCRIIVVNAFYDEESRAAAQEIARHCNCDFLCAENRGYGCGNNLGIRYAQTHYAYRYLIISNPDVLVQHFPALPVTDAGLIAPEITTLRGRRQNPMVPYESRLREWLIYQGFRHDCRPLVAAGIAVGKLLRAVFAARCRLHKKPFYPIYTAHGSFLLLSRAAIQALGPDLYDENMFLFGEEGALAQRLKRRGIRTVFLPGIRVLHKEDGSMKLSSISVSGALKASNIYYYEHYRMAADGER
jgi:GT2 family glycosyltransferase